MNCANAQVESVTQHLLLKSVLDLANENFMENLQKSFSNLLMAANEGIFSIVAIYFGGAKQVITMAAPKRNY
jgi:hypothetical protein